MIIQYRKKQNFLVFRILLLVNINLCSVWNQIRNTSAIHLRWVTFHGHAFLTMCKQRRSSECIPLLQNRTNIKMRKMHLFLFLKHFIDPDRSAVKSALSVTTHEFLKMEFHLCASVLSSIKLE